MTSANLTDGLGFAGPMVTGGLGGVVSSPSAGPGRVLTRGLRFGGFLLAGGLGAASSSDVLPDDFVFPNPLMTHFTIY